jgi:hypothetical protein
LRHIAEDLRLYSPPTTRNLPVLDFSLIPVFRALSIRNVIIAFKLLLLECRVLVHSASLALVTRVCEALMAFLYPLQWEMVYVPVVPEALQGMLFLF